MINHVNNRLQEAIMASYETTYKDEFRLIRKLANKRIDNFMQATSSKLTRVPAHQGNNAYWIKEYIYNNTEDNSGLQAREFAVLTRVNLAQHLMPNIASFVRIQAVNEDVGQQLIMHDYGLTLLDWYHVFYRSSSNSKSFLLPSTLLRIVEKTLNALKQLHSKKFLHCDLKIDNVCIPVEDFSITDGSGNITGKLNLDKLRIIDLGFSLLPEANTRTLWGRNKNLYPSGKYISPRFSAEVFLAMRLCDMPNKIFPEEIYFMYTWLMKNNYLLENTSCPNNIIELNQKLSHIGRHLWETNGFPNALKYLDWRVDFFSLAYFIEDLFNNAQFSQDNKIELDALLYLRNLKEQLLDIHNNNDLPQTLPHESLLNGISNFIENKRISLNPPAFNLNLNEFCNDIKPGFENPVDALWWLIKNQPENKERWKWLKDNWQKPSKFIALPLALTVFSYGAYTVWQNGKMESFLPEKPAVQRLLEAFPQHPGAMVTASLHMGSADNPQSQIQIGDAFSFTASNPLPQDGYLTVFAADAEDETAQRLIVVQDNLYIRSMSQVTCPRGATCDDLFENSSWPVTGPAGKVHMMAIITPAQVPWPLVHPPGGKSYLNVTSFNNLNDVSMLFNCASQNNPSDQDACQNALQRFVVSPVVTYEVLARPAS